MIIDGDELGLEAAFYAILGVVVGIAVLGPTIALVASKSGGRRLGLGSVGLGLVVAVALVVAVFVLYRTAGGDATGWDWLWAIGLGTAAAWSVRRLTVRDTGAPSEERDHSSRPR